MIMMELHKIVIDEKRHDQLIVLKEKDGERLLPIVIGLAEASAIKLKLSGFNPPRPLTHDLLYTMITSLDAVLEKIMIDQLLDSTFHAKLVLRLGNGQVKIVDARPSDSIALAVRAHVPVYVEEAIVSRIEDIERKKASS